MNDVNAVSSGINDLACAIEHASRSQLTEDDLGESIKLAKAGLKKLQAAKALVSESIFSVCPAPYAGPSHQNLFDGEE